MTLYSIEEEAGRRFLSMEFIDGQPLTKYADVQELDDRQRLELVDVPEVLRGAPITLITAGLLTLGFMGFAGMIR
mgnify:CR=1 FL=1